MNGPGSPPGARDRAPEDLGDDLLIAVDDDPAGARKLIDAALARALADGDRVAELHARRALGVCIRFRDPPGALRELDAAFACADGDVTLQGIVRISRGACRYIARRRKEGRADLRSAIATLDGVNQAVARYQLASIDAREDINMLRAAARIGDEIPALRSGGKRLYVAHALTNRGLCLAYADKFEWAANDMFEARELYRALGVRLGGAIALHNVAFIQRKRGEIRQAFDTFQQARRELLAVRATNHVVELDLDWCEALLAAGLVTEACKRADLVVRRLRRRENGVDHPEALLVAAYAYAQSGRPRQALNRAARAEAAFGKDRPTWADLAALVRLACAPPRTESLADAARLARRFHRRGVAEGAARARLLVADLQLHAGGARRVRRRLSLDWPTLPPDVRIQSYELAARVADAAGDSAQCTHLLRRGLDELDHYEQSFASAEVRWSVSLHGRKLLRTGRDLALRDGGPDDLFHWLEAARANALRHAPLEPPEEEPALDELLGKLRAELGAMGQREDPLSRRKLTPQQLRLLRAIADLERKSRPASAGRSAGVISREALSAALGSRVLMHLEIVGDQLLALRTDSTGSRIIPLGAARPFLDLLTGANGVLNRLALANLSPAARSVELARLASRGRALDDQLGESFRDVDEVVIVPTSGMHAAPWGIVPSIGATAFVVAGSATTWDAARLTARGDERVVLVAGAGLDHAEAEVAAIAGVHPSARVFGPAAAISTDVLRAVDGASLAHFATHHQHRREHALLGWLELADGPLFLYDLLRVTALPRVVVLSACGAASGDEGPVGDVLSATTVMMERGTATVVASPNLVADNSTTSGVMLELHRLLAAGTSPATALRQVRVDAGGDELQAALVGAYSCFGTG